MSTQPMEYEITAHTVLHGVSEAHCADETIRFDSSATPASELLPGPAELLAAAFAACVLKNVERFAGMLPFRYDSASITVHAKRQQTPPRFTEIRYELAVVTDEPPDRVDLLHRNIVRQGTVFNTLAASCEVSGSIQTRTPADNLGGQAPQLADVSDTSWGVAER